MEMKPKAAILIVAVNLAALVLLAIFSPQLMISPGKPIDAHAEFATDCFACHTPFIGSPAAKCIACHKVEEIGKITTKGLAVEKEKKNVSFHQQLVEDDCISCHSDHKGVKAFRPISHFSHNLLESTLQEQCDSCHSNPVDDLHQKVKGSCGQCHSQNAWIPATFEHEEYFRFDEDHNTECVTCHINNDYADYTCYGCHEHSRSKIREEHVEEGIRDYENCVECHRSGDEDEAKRIWRSKDFNAGKFKVKRDKSGKDRKYEHRDDDDD
jgi:hypothetical protein